jgi:hypothetical protein
MILVHAADPELCRRILAAITGPTLIANAWREIAT